MYRKFVKYVHATIQSNRFTKQSEHIPTNSKIVETYTHIQQLYHDRRTNGTTKCRIIFTVFIQHAYVETKLQYLVLLHKVEYHKLPFVL